MPGYFDCTFSKRQLAALLVMLAGALIYFAGVANNLYNPPALRQARAIRAGMRLDEVEICMTGIRGVVFTNPNQLQGSLKGGGYHLNDARPPFRRQVVAFHVRWDTLFLVYVNESGNVYAVRFAQT